VFPHPTSTAQAGFKETPARAIRIDRKYDDTQPLSLFVFKTLPIPSPARSTIFKVKKRCPKNDATASQFQSQYSGTIFSTHGGQGNSSRKFRASLGRYRRHRQMKEHYRAYRWDKSAPITINRAVAGAFITFRVEPKSPAPMKMKSASPFDTLMEERRRHCVSPRSANQGILLAGNGQQHVRLFGGKLQKRYKRQSSHATDRQRFPYRETSAARQTPKASTRNSRAGTASSVCAASSSKPGRTQQGH